MEKVKPAQIIKSAIAPAGMNTALLINPGEFKIKRIALPEPGPGEVRIKLEGCGICASNLPMWEGREWFDYPGEAGAPGHEGWGIIDKTGSHIFHLKKGDPVAGLSYHAFAEYDIAAANSVVKLPESLNGRIFLGEPLACAMNIFRRSDIRPGQYVAIIGIGFLGSLLTQLASKIGAKVIAISQRASSLDIAEKMGSDEIIPFGNHLTIIEKVKRLTANQFCERVIESTGKQDPLTLAAELTAIKGKLIIAGYHQDGLRQVNMQLWNWRGLDVINAHEREPAENIKGMREAVKAVVCGKLDPEPLYTPQYTLSNLAEGFQTLQHRPDGFMKAVIRNE